MSSSCILALGHSDALDLKNSGITWHHPLSPYQQTPSTSFPSSHPKKNICQPVSAPPLRPPPIRPAPPRPSLRGRSRAEIRRWNRPSRWRCRRCWRNHGWRGPTHLGVPAGPMEGLFMANKTAIEAFLVTN